MGRFISAARRVALTVRGMNRPVLIGMVASAVVLSGCTVSDVPPVPKTATSAPAAGSREATGPTPAGGSSDAAVARTALSALLAARSRALQTADAAAWSATIADPHGPDGTAEAAAYAGLLALGVRRLDVSEVGATADVSPPTTAATDAGPASGRPTWTGSVRLGYAIPGFDRGIRWSTRTITVTQVGGEWLIQRWLGPSDRWEAFDLAPLAVVRTGRALVVGPVGVDVLQARLGEVEVGQDRVAAVLDEAVPAVVVVPATPEQAAHLLGETPTPTGQTGSDPAGGHAPLVGQVAATTQGARDPSAPAVADRIVLDPDGLARLTPAGRRVVLTHELTHVWVRASTLHDLPLWLSEGFAEWVAFREEGMDPPVVAARLLSQVRASGPPATLPTPTDFAGTTGDPAAAYQGSWLAADRIATLSGRQGLVGLVRRVGAVAGPSGSTPGPVDLGAALVVVVGQSLAQFVAGWRSELVRLARI